MDFNSFGLDQQEQQKKMQLAQALQGQAFAPMQARQAGRFVVAPGPLEGVSKIAMALASKNAGNDAQAAGMRVQQGRGEMLSQALAASQPQPAIPSPQPELGGGPARPAMEGNPLRGMEMLARTQDPTLIQMGQPVFAAQEKAAESERQRQFRESQALLADTRQRELAQQRSEDMRQRQETDQGFRREMAELRAQGDRPYFQFLPTATGYMAGNARAGTVAPVMHQGAPVIPGAMDPNLQGQLSGAKATGKEKAEVQVAAEADLPRIVDNANNAIKLTDKLLSHPGFKTSVGVGLGGITKRVPGTDAAGFHSLLDQVKGGAFLEAFNSIKGAGQITEIEGKKATDAITRMSAATSESEFKDAADDYKTVIKTAVERAKKKAGGATAPYSGPERRIPAVGTVQDGYKFKGGNPADPQSWEKVK